MKRIFFFIAVMMSCSNIAFAQSKLGEVACVYVTTADLDSSVATYEKLGFKKTGSNTFPVPWAQVSDGSLLIMMRKDTMKYIGLTYYVTDIENTVAELEKSGISFTQKPKETDVIKRYYFKSPDGFDIMLASNVGAFKQPEGLNLVTMNPADHMQEEKYPNKVCGAFGEFAHPVKDVKISSAFWQKLGFKVIADMSAPYPHAILSDGKMIIGLHQTDHFNYPAVTYFGMNAGKRIDQLKQKGVKPFTEVMGNNNQVLVTWEGQHFFIFSLGM